jgi:hypothetical protein
MQSFIQDYQVGGKRSVFDKYVKLQARIELRNDLFTSEYLRQLGDKGKAIQYFDI